MQKNITLNLQTNVLFMSHQILYAYFIPTINAVKVSIDILIYIQQDATLHNLFYLETAVHVSGGSTAHHQKRKQLYLQHLVLVTPLLLPAAIAAGSSNGKMNCVTLHLVGHILEYSYDERAHER
jgi:hypothetical protein